MVNLQIYKYWQIKDKNGKVIRQTRRLKCKSFVKGFGGLLECIMAHPYSTASDVVAVIDTSGASKNIATGTSPDSYQCFGVECPAATTTYGMQVGTGTTAPAISDTAIQTLIAHGTGAGQLQYGVTIVGSYRIEGTSVKILIQRAFTNGSGGSITVRESTLVATWYVSAITYFLIIHEAENQAIADAQTGTLFYDLVMTV